MRTLIKTLSVERGKLFITTNGKRLNLKNCRLSIEIYELSKALPIMGVVGYDVKIHHEGLLDCETMDLINPEHIEPTSQYEIVGDIEKFDYTFERFNFSNLTLTELNLPRGVFSFEIKDQTTIRKLIDFPIHI